MSSLSAIKTGNCKLSSHCIIFNYFCQASCLCFFFVFS
nr:MAG TPA: hypothetical protein [Caudoviricetes sp.]